MISIDTNVLIYAHRKESPNFPVAYEAVRRLVEGKEPWLLSWAAAHEFIAVVTNPRIYKPPTTLAEAIAQLETWFASPSVRVFGEGQGYWGHFKRLALAADVRGSEVYDIRIAAVGLSHGTAEVLTNDSDFDRIESIRVQPL